MDKALKTGIVKNELRKQWDLEAAAIEAAKNPVPEATSSVESEEELAPSHPEMTEDWALKSSASPHPNAAKELHNHLRGIATATRL